MDSFVSLVSQMFSSLVSIFIYIGVSLGLFRMMRALNMKNAWMAWVPVCNAYALGSLADEQCARNEGTATNYRKKLLTWNIVNISLGLVVCIALVVFLVLVILTSFGGGAADWAHMDWEFSISDAMGTVLVPIIIFALLIWLPFAIVYMVYYYIALNKIYKLYAPSGSTGLTVLSIFVSIAVPIIFLVLSGRKPVLCEDAYGDTPTDPTNPSDGGQGFYSL